MISKVFGKPEYTRVERLTWAVQPEVRWSCFVRLLRDEALKAASFGMRPLLAAEDFAIQGSLLPECRCTHGFARLLQWQDLFPRVAHKDHIQDSCLYIYIYNTVACDCGGLGKYMVYMPYIYALHFYFRFVYIVLVFAVFQPAAKMTAEVCKAMEKASQLYNFSNLGVSLDSP